MDDALYSLVTEQQNEHSLNIDIMDTIDVLKIMNDEDKKVAYAVEECLDDITLAVDKIVERMKKGGRLLYFGAGTSGRLAILDAAECPHLALSPNWCRVLWRWEWRIQHCKGGYRRL